VLTDQAPGAIGVVSSDKDVEVSDSLSAVYTQPNTIADLRSGLFGDYIDAFLATWTSQGYSRNTLREKLRLIRGWARWLNLRGIKIVDLDESLLDGYLNEISGGARITLTSVLAYLRDIKVVLTACPSPEETPRLQIERDYELYLRRERGLAAITIRYHLFHVHRFLSERFGSQDIRLDRIRQKDITSHVLLHASEYRQRSAQTWISVLRCFMRYLHLRGDTTTDMTGCVLKTADWNMAGLPKYIEADKVEELLGSIDRTTAVGLRDYAILIIIARLGLRAGEVANLELEDFDWHEGTFRVKGKNARWARLPITKEVGAAVVEYLRRGRPACSTRKVFITAVAPHRGIKSGATVSGIAAQHLERADIVVARKGAHVLRHSLATKMLRSGSSLEEICQVLRHLHLSTTEIYAKVDYAALKEIAQAWPVNRA
jgi:site-specific recombinase XerD